MKKIFSLLSIALLFSCSKKVEEPVEEKSVFTPAPKKEIAIGDKNLVGYSLITASDCVSCHKDSDKLIGPSYKEIAEKYSEKDIEILASKIIDGGKGVWGEVPMQAHPQVSKEDAKKMVAYILSMKK